MSTPANTTTPSATARTGSPMVASMSTPRCERSPPSRSTPRPLVPSRGAPSSGDVTASPASTAGRRRGGSRTPSSRRRRAVKRAVLGVAPHTRRPRRSGRRRCGAACCRPRDRSARCSASHIASSAAPTRRLCAGSSRRHAPGPPGETAAGAAREHRRLDLEQADAGRACQRRPAAALPVGERRHQERIGLGLGADLAHEARDLGRPASAPPRRRGGPPRRRSGPPRAVRSGPPARPASRTGSFSSWMPRLRGPSTGRWRRPATTRFSGLAAGGGPAWISAARRARASGATVTNTMLPKIGGRRQDL